MSEARGLWQVMPSGRRWGKSITDRELREMPAADFNRAIKKMAEATKPLADSFENLAAAMRYMGERYSAHMTTVAQDFAKGGALASDVAVSYAGGPLTGRMRSGAPNVLCHPCHERGRSRQATTTVFIDKQFQPSEGARRYALCNDCAAKWKMLGFPVDAEPLFDLVAKACRPEARERESMARPARRAPRRARA